MKKLAIASILFALLLTLAGCSDSSSSYNGGYDQWKKDNGYDRHYDNDEIYAFVNSYDGKW